MKVLCTVQPTKPTISISRRAIVALPVIPLVLAPSAKALIPDDSDEELIEKAKLNKAARLQKDKQLEKVSAASTGNLDLALGATIQGAVRALAIVGGALEKNDLKEAAAGISGLDGAKLGEALLALSTTSDANKLAETVNGDIKALQAAVKGGQAAEARSAFVASARSLKTWAVSTNVAASIRGL